MENKDLKKIVTFHFVSGKSINIEYSQEKFNEIIEFLNGDWINTNSCGEFFGINFRLVTHYEVK